MQIATVGDNCIDVYLGAEETRVPGGNAVNVAVAIACQKIHSAYLGVVGNDMAGNELLQAMHAKSVDVSLVETKEGPTGRTEIEVVNGERHFTGEAAGIQSPLLLSPQMLEKLLQFSLVHFTAFSNWKDGWKQHQPNLPKELKYLRGQKIMTSLDFGEIGELENVQSLLEHRPNITFFSQPGRVVADAISRARDVVGKTQAVVVVTMGAGGSVVLGKNGRADRIDAKKIKVVDTCGAGDSYIGTFLAGLASGKTLIDSARKATEVAARVCKDTGAWPKC